MIDYEQRYHIYEAYAHYHGPWLSDIIPSSMNKNTDEETRNCMRSQLIAQEWMNE